MRAAVAGGADLVELRVDLIGDLPAVEALLRGPRGCGFILTLRPAHEGGGWDGDEAERISLIERLALLCPGYVDIELSTWRRSANLRQKIGLVCDTSGADARVRAGGAADLGGTRAAPPGERARNRLILSHHDFLSTPDNLDALFDELEETPAFAIKAAFLARDSLDALRALDQLRRRSAGRRVVALSMGEAGLVTRVAAPKFGAFMTFAALAERDASAPGQPTLAELQDRYRWRDTAAATPLYGIVGWPVTHSRSPHVHNAAMSAAGIDGLYVPLPVRSDDDAFAAFMNTLDAADWLGLRGLSVTLPHKERALRWVRDRGGATDAVAARCGAANTLARRPATTPADVGAGWLAANTDGPAAHESLAAALTRPPPWRVTVLGAGGAARAIVAALTGAGHAVTVFNRTATRAERLAHELGCAWDRWEQRAATPADAVVNCTSVGLGAASDESPFPPGVWKTLRVSDAPVAFDAVYGPRETRFLRDARAAGCAVVSGADMFLRQAARQFVLWHGLAPPPDVMRKAFDAGQRA